MSKQNFVSFNGCAEPLHTFARCGEDIFAYHADNSECKGAEFNLSDLLNDELPEMDEMSATSEHFEGVQNV